MCSGDFSLDIWRFDKEDKKAYLDTEVLHVCRDFVMLGSWAEKNRVYLKEVEDFDNN